MLLVTHHPRVTTNNPHLFFSSLKEKTRSSWLTREKSKNFVRTLGPLTAKRNHGGVENFSLSVSPHGFGRVESQELTNLNSVTVTMRPGHMWAQLNSVTVTVRPGHMWAQCVCSLYKRVGHARDSTKLVFSLITQYNSDTCNTHSPL